MLIILIYYQLIQNLQVKMKKQQKKWYYKPTTKFKYSFSNAQAQQSDYSKIAEKYSELIVDKLDDDNFDKGKKEEIKVNGEKYKVRPVTLTLSRADTKNYISCIRRS